MNIAQLIADINRYAPGQRGVFGISDLSNLMPIEWSKLKVTRTLDRLIKAGVVSKIQRGIYVTPQFDLGMLSRRIAPESYVSMDTVLARNGLIGTVPEYSFSVVDTRRGRTIPTPRGPIRFYSIQSDLRFGFEYQGAVAFADSEKAFLDILYFYTKGQRFVIDPRNEIDVSKLNQKKIITYLKRYKNPKFIQFVKGLLDEKS